MKRPWPLSSLLAARWGLKLNGSWLSAATERSWLQNAAPHSGTCRQGGNWDNFKRRKQEDFIKHIIVSYYMQVEIFGGKYFVSTIDFCPQKEFWFCPHKGGRGIPLHQLEFWFCPHKGGEENTKLGFILGFLPQSWDCWFPSSWACCGHQWDITYYITKGDNGFDFVLNSSIFSQ